MPDYSLLPDNYIAWLKVASVVICVALLFAVYFMLYYLIKIKRIRKIMNTSVDDVLFCDIAYFKEKGKRKNQEDSLYISPMRNASTDGIIVAVSDGMGGLNDGEIVSKYVTDKIADNYPFDFENTEEGAAKIRQISDDIYDKYRLCGGATVAMVHIMSNAMQFYSLGDSNIILVRNNKATVLNPKQNYLGVLIKKLATSGENTHEAYINKRYRALVDFVGNLNSRVMKTSKPIRLFEDDVIIVCSDGVTDTVPVVSIPKYTDGSARNIAERLKVTIRARKSKVQDNYTAVVIRMDRNFI